MAGQPRKRAVATELEIRARNVAEDESYTVLDYVVDWTESGKTLTKLATEISKATGHDISIAILNSVLRNAYGDAAIERVQAARKVGAHTMVDDAIDLVDNASTSSSEDLRKADMQAKVRQWTAERFNPDAFGSQKGVKVQINVGVLHLDAMRQRAIQLSEQAECTRAFTSDADLSALPATTNDATVVDYEIVSDSNAAS